MKQYKKDDRVNFYTDGKEFRYVVKDSYLTHIDGDNAAIFKRLGLLDEKKRFCEKWYGYKPLDDGIWPYCKDNDYEALNRLIKALHEECSIKSGKQETMKRTDTDWDRLPDEIKHLVQVRTEEQGNIFDADDFRETISKSSGCRGFHWSDTLEGHGFWNKVLAHKNYDHFFEKYPVSGRPMVDIKDIEEGDYLYSKTYATKKSREYGTIVKVIEVIDPQWDIRYEGINLRKCRCENKVATQFRYATESEILASKYADEYKSNINFKSSKHEVQKEIKSDIRAGRGKSVRTRRTAGKITSASRLVGNTVRGRTRKAKIGRSKVKPSVVSTGYHRSAGCSGRPF